MKKRFAERLEGLRNLDGGFTLLELLVSIVILSILVATASQFYLQHRRKAWEAQVRSSVRHMAGAENYFMFGHGAPAFTKDLDDLYLVGYRWNDVAVRPYVALATNQTFCVQVHSAHDASIVWHFSSDIGRPQPGPATPRDCGDPDVLGTYIAGLPPANAGRDGLPGVFGDGYTMVSRGSNESSSDGDSSEGEGELGSGGSGGGSDGSDWGTGTGTGADDDDTTVVGSTPGYGTEDTTSGTNPSDTTGSSSGCTGGGTGSGSTSGTNHPSGKDRDTERGGSGSQGSSGSDPDGDENDGADKPGQEGGADTGDQDGNNGSGNDSDFEDDNRGPNFGGHPGDRSSC